jgi:nucleotide-binding universal stress UspA family protein
LRLAARLGALFGAEVIVQQVVASEHEEEGARAALARFLPRELARLGPRVLVRQGKPWAAVVRAVEEQGADLAVIPAAGRETERSKDAARIVRHAACPVLVA